MSYQSRYNPLAIALLLFSVGVYVGYLKLSEWRDDMRIAGVIFLAVYALWIFAEFNITVGEINKGGSKADRFTCEAYSIARGITVLCGLLFPTLWTTPGIWMIVGITVFIASIVFRLTAIYTLGKFYSHRVRLREDHHIVAAGPYRLVRHPAYTGMFFAHVGYAIFFFNWYVLSALLVLFLPVLIYRILLEEKVLFTLPGYKDYAAHRARLIPLAW